MLARQVLGRITYLRTRWSEVRTEERDKSAECRFECRAPEGRGAGMHLVNHDDRRTTNRQEADSDERAMRVRPKGHAQDGRGQLRPEGVRSEASESKICRSKFGPRSDSQSEGQGWPELISLGAPFFKGPFGAPFSLSASGRFELGQPRTRISRTTGSSTRLRVSLASNRVDGVARDPGSRLQ